MGFHSTTIYGNNPQVFLSVSHTARDLIYQLDLIGDAFSAIAVTEEFMMIAISIKPLKEEKRNAKKILTVNFLINSFSFFTSLIIKCCCYLHVLTYQKTMGICVKCKFIYFRKSFISGIFLTATGNIHQILISRCDWNFYCHRPESSQNWTIAVEMNLHDAKQSSMSQNNQKKVPQFN